MRILIVSAGEGSRWCNYLGVPKHLAPVDGEPILYRTVRLLKQFNTISEIYIIGPNDSRYKLEGTKLYTPNINSLNYDADKFLSSEELWSNTDRTVILFGDVFFTEQALDTIINCNLKSWLAFGRFNGSAITGSKYGEIFGHSFYPDDIKQHKESLLHAIELVKQRKAKKGNGWEHYRIMQGATDSEVRLHKRYSQFIEIDDWTEDFDFPKDYDMWINRWNKK